MLCSVNLAHARCSECTDLSNLANSTLALWDLLERVTDTPALPGPAPPSLRQLHFVVQDAQPLGCVGAEGERQPGLQEAIAFLPPSPPHQHGVFMGLRS